MAKFRATDKITKNPHRSCVILWGFLFLLFLSRYGDGGEVSQLALRMTSNSLSLFEVIGRRCPRTIFCVGGYVGRRSMICSIAARVVCFALPVLWRTHFLCLDVEDSVPHTPCKPSSARLDPALCLVTPFCFGARFCARSFLLLLRLRARSPKFLIAQASFATPSHIISI